MKELAQHSNKNRDMQSIVTSIEHSTSNTPIFTLNTPNDFASRSQDVFGKLLRLEKHHETWMSENAIETNDIPEIEISEPVLELPKTDNEIFKKPIPTKEWKSKQTSIPVFKRPTKVWKKYSLEDVPIVSDAKNTVIALQCIAELRQRKESHSVEDNSVEQPMKILFSKPKGHNLRSSSKMCSPVEPKAKEKEDTKSPKINLQHLEDE